VELLARYPGALSSRVIGDAIRDPDPLVRRATVAGLDSAPREQRVYWLAPMLRDPVRAVRIEAARQLAALPDSAIGETHRAAFNAALADLEESHRVNQDRADGRIGLGNLYLARGRSGEAEAAYRSALAFDPVPVPAVVNLADFYRAGGRESKAEAVLRQGLVSHPRNAALSRALALSLVRQGRKPEALKLLASSAAENTDVAYLYALALDDAGRRGEALRVLERALPKSNGSRDILVALASFEQRDGNLEKAAGYLKRLAAINPYDPALAESR
jgi:Flp pilus assembly protein TadD